jgi:hypothetical protein
MSRIRPDESGTMVSISGENPVICRDAIVDGFHIHDETGQIFSAFYSENALVSNFWFEANRNTNTGAGIVLVSYGDAVFDKVYIRDNYSESYAAILLISSGKLSISNSEIVNNLTSTTWGSGGIHNEGGLLVKIRNSKLFKNTGGSGNYQGFAYGGGTFDVDFCTIQGMRAGFYPETGSEIAWGANNTPY